MGAGPGPSAASRPPCPILHSAAWDPVREAGRPGSRLLGPHGRPLPEAAPGPRAPPSAHPLPSGAAASTLEGWPGPGVLCPRPLLWRIFTLSGPGSASVPPLCSEGSALSWAGSWAGSGAVGKGTSCQSEAAGSHGQKRVQGACDRTGPPGQDHPVIL